MIPHDLRIIVGYYSRTEARRVCGSDASGWYVHASNNEGYAKVLPFTRISASDALEIAEAVDESLAGVATPTAVRTTVQAVVDSLARTRNARRKTVEQRIADAQADLAAIDSEDA